MQSLSRAEYNKALYFHPNKFPSTSYYSSVYTQCHVIYARAIDNQVTIKVNTGIPIVWTGTTNRYMKTYSFGIKHPYYTEDKPRYVCEFCHENAQHDCSVFTSDGHFNSIIYLCDECWNMSKRIYSYIHNYHADDYSNMELLLSISTNINKHNKVQKYLSKLQKIVPNILALSLLTVPDIAHVICNMIKQMLLKKYRIFLQ